MEHYPPFRLIILRQREVPMYYSPVRRGSKPTRLACIRHAASVHPEPGSNSYCCLFCSQMKTERLNKFSKPRYSFVVPNLLELTYMIPITIQLPKCCLFKAFSRIFQSTF